MSGKPNIHYLSKDTQLNMTLEFNKAHKQFFPYKIVIKLNLIHLEIKNYEQ